MRPWPAALDRLHEHPAAVLPLVVEELVHYYEAVVAPVWPRVSALLEADLEYRARRVADGGLAGTFADLDERITYHVDRLEIAKPYDCRHMLQGVGLLLVPSAFIWPGLSAVPDPRGAPMITYPAGGIAELWLGVNGDGNCSDAWEDTPVAELVGKSRALMLAHLDLPMTTTQLAERMRISPPSVSGHLSILRRSDLVTSYRAGRQVFYRRTELASTLLKRSR